VVEWEIVKGVVQSSANTDAENWTAFEGCRAIEVYTDGSAPIRNPGGRTGFAAVLLGRVDFNSENGQSDAGSAAYAKLTLGGYVPERTKEPATSNNRAEIAGVLAALEALRRLAGSTSTVREAVIWTDSTYVVNCANGTWRRKKNTDLWPVLDRLLDEVRGQVPGDVTIRWQRGHAGHEHNEAADELATRAAFDFDEAEYKRYRAAQTATGREMPGAKALASSDADSAATLDTLKPGEESWLTGSDYTIVLQTHMNEASATFGTSTGYFGLFASDGRYRQTKVDHKGHHGPNEAEYQTLIAVLKHIQERISAAGRDTRNYTLTIYSHSELVVKQLRGEFRVKAPALQYCYAEAVALVNAFKSVEFKWKHQKEIAKLFRG
jgi:ribonuclease HI